MNRTEATESLSALAHETRLEVFQHVLRAGPEGLPASTISQLVNVLPSTLSGHLNTLRHAKLLQSRREQQKIIYSANTRNMSDLITFLTRDCCGGHPEICADLSKMVNSQET